MTPQLQQAIKLLALSNLEVEAFIAEALDANPLLDTGEAAPDMVGELADDAAGPAERGTSLEETPSDRLIAEGRGEDDRPLDIAAEALDRDRDTGEGALDDGEWGAAGNQTLTRAEGRDGVSPDSSGEISLAEHLNKQVGLASSDLRQEFLARYLIGQIDDAGYLTMSLSEAAQELGVSVAEMERALAVVHSLEPAGVGACNLAECLALQARDADRYDPCMAALIDNLDLIAKGAFQQLRRICKVDEEDFADMLAELRTYDPRPGQQFGSSPGAAIVPDVLIEQDGKGGWKIALNEATLPRLVVNRVYYLELRNGSADRESRAWLQGRLGDANWLIKALDQRQKTILKVSAEILKQQEGFFRRGVSELKPLTLRTVAEAIDMHESTVSRVTSNKYLHCDRGTFELKYFFTSGVGADADGEGGASSEAVKARIKALTDAEDPGKILSDDKLVDLLKAEGFDLARRTVAKYREAMNIGSSVQRRRSRKMEGLR